MHVRKGDLVQLISGSEKGKQGKVLRVDHKHGRVKVEGIRVVKRHVKPAGGKPGSIESKEAFIPASTVMPVDPKTGEPTRVSIREVEGKRVRVAEKSGTVLEQTQS